MSTSWCAPVTLRLLARCGRRSLAPLCRYEYIRKLDAAAAEAGPSSREVSPDPPGAEAAAAAAGGGGGKRGAEEGADGGRRVKGRAGGADAEDDEREDPEWSGGMEE